MRESRTPDDLGKAYRVLAALVITIVFAGGATVAVRAAYGAFSDDFEVAGMFPRAGQSLRPGSDVKYRGVTVGKVRKIQLVKRQVKITLGLHKGSEVPATTRATVRPKTLFGEKYIELSYDPKAGPPYLAKGSTLRSTGTSEEVEGLVSGVDHLLRGIDTTELATLMTELTEAAQGEGTKVARLITRGAAAADVLQDTLDQQVHALQSLQRFTRQYRDIAPDLNATGANLNRFLPAFNQARADFERLLTTLRPFADHLADLIETNEANIDGILDNGDNIVRVVIAHKQDIADVVYGLSRYTFKFASGASKETLPDGSKMAYFKVFIDLTDIRELLCSVITTPLPAQLSELQSIPDALAKANPLLSCDGSGSGALDGTLGSEGPVAQSPGSKLPTAAPGATTSPPKDQLDQKVAEALAQTQQDQGGSQALSSLFGPLLGAGAP